MKLPKTTSSNGQLVVWGCFIVVVISLAAIGHWNFLSGNKLYWHDSIPAMINMHLFYDSIFRGSLALWSPEINSGQPLWTQVETMPSFDLFAVACWTLAHIFHQKSIIAYQWTCTLWLTVFSCSGMLCSRYLYRNWWINFIVFIMLFSGPVSTSISTQSYGLLIPFRYTPLVILLFLRLISYPSYKRSIALGMVIGLSSAGYQTPYSLLFITMFITIYTIFSTTDRSSIFSLLSIKLAILTLIVAAIVMLPTIVACHKMLKLQPIARMLFTSGYLYSTNTFFNELFAPLFYFITIPQKWTEQGGISTINKLLEIITPFNGRHGSAYIGTIPLFACLFIPLIAISKKIPHFHGAMSNTFSALELTWMVITFLCIALCLDKGIINLFGHSSFLGLRNWGFSMTLVIFCFSQLVAIGFRHTRSVIYNNPMLSQRLSLIIRKKGLIGLNIFLLVALNYATFSFQNNFTGFTADSLATQMEYFPEPGTGEILFANKRLIEFDINQYAPLHYE